MAISLCRDPQVSLGDVPEASLSPGLRKQVGVSVHGLSLYMCACVLTCGVWVGGKAMGVLMQLCVWSLQNTPETGRAVLGEPASRSQGQLCLVARGQSYMCGQCHCVLPLSPC